MPDPRHKVVAFRTSPSELKAITLAAQRTDEYLSAFMRRAALREAERVAKWTGTLPAPVPVATARGRGEE